MADELLPDDPSLGDAADFADDAPKMRAPATDDEAIRQIRRHTSPLGRIVTVCVIVAAAGLGYFYYQSNEAYERRMDAVNAAAAMADIQQALPVLRGELDRTSYSDVKERIIRALGRFRDADSVPQLIRALDDSPTVRREAALALAAIGLPAAATARPALLAVLPKTDERDRPQVVWALAVLQEGAASEAILQAFTAGLLQAQPGFEPRVITAALGRERLSSSALIRHPSEAVRLLTAQALAEIGTAEAIEPLTRVLDAELAREPARQSAEVLRAAATGLGRTGDPRGAEPLFRLLEAQPSLRMSVIEAMRKSISAPGLAVLVQHARDVGLQRDLVRLLAETHDPRAVDTLVGLLGSADEEIRSTAATMLAEFGDVRAVDVLATLAREPDSATSNDAIDALARLGKPELAPRLLELLRDLPGRKAAILRALGKTRDPDVASAVEAELTSDDMRAAALALADLGSESGYGKLVDMLPRPADVDMSVPSIPNEMLFLNRKAAVDAVGFYGRPEPSTALMTIVEDPKDDGRLREAAAISLGRIATPEVVQTVMGKVSDAALPEDARRYYAWALWQKPHPEHNDALLTLLGSDAPMSVREAAAVAIGYAGAEANDARLIELLENEATRRPAALAISISGGTASLAKLIEWLGRDRDMTEVVEMAHMRNEVGWFSVITAEMFDSGQIWRRMRAALALREGAAAKHYAFAWNRMIELLKSGWDGPGGLQPMGIRERLWQSLTGEDAEVRALTALLLSEIPERGILLRARDNTGPGQQEAREALLRMNR